MITILLKSCGRCGRLIQYPNTYCPDCKPYMDRIIAERKAQQRKRAGQKYNKKRDPKYMRFYSSNEWRILSSKYRQDKGYKCECCGRIATEVHHVQPIQTDDGWERRLDYNNLKLVCLECHNKEHDRFQTKPRKRI